MGPENKIDLTGYTLFLDGEPVEQIGTLPEITVAADAPEPDGVFGSLSDLSLEMKGTFKTPKRWRCRSRKRFIKLMMSEGISRNGAVWLADFIRGLMPYGEAWRQYVLFNTWIIKVG